MQRTQRLTRNEDFTAVYRRGKSVANHQFVLYYRAVSRPYFRLGVSASKKIGGAVVRNRMRRIVKEVVRHMSDEVAPGYDLVIIVRAAATSLDYAALEKSIRHVLKRASLLKAKK